MAGCWRSLRYLCLCLYRYIYVNESYKIFRQILAKNEPKILESSTCKIFSSLRGSSAFSLNPKQTNSDPISTTFFNQNLFCSIKVDFFCDFPFLCFRLCRYFHTFSAPKRGIQSIPRGAARLLVFFFIPNGQNLIYV